MMESFEAILFRHYFVVVIFFNFFHEGVCIYYIQYVSCIIKETSTF